MYQQGVVRNDDGTNTYHYFSLTSGYVRIERLSVIEVFNLVNEIDGAADVESVLIKWADGYRDADMYELADCGDDWEMVLAGEILSRWPVD